MEHLQHFAISGDPFRNEPLLRDAFQTPASKDALARLERGVRQRRGLLVFTGESGAGKTLLLRQLLEQLEEEVFEASLLVVLSGAADAGWMLTRFAKQLGVEEPAAERDALLAQVYEQLAIVREEGRHAVLIIDDAHALAAGGGLADTCGLLKLEYEERRLFSLVLSGSPQLAAAIAADPNLARRVEVNVQMQPLDATAAAFYLAKRLEMAGGDTSLLESGAVESLHRLGCGRPGLMNVLADNALYEAYLAGRKSVGAEDVARAHAGLGWGAPPAAKPGAPRRGAAPRTPEPTLVIPPEGQGGEPVDLFDAVDAPGGDLDSDLDAVFAGSGMRMPDEGPPKDEDEEDLVVALLED